MTEQKPFAWTCYRGNGDQELSFDFPVGSDVSSARPLFLSSVSRTSGGYTASLTADEPHIKAYGAQSAKVTSTDFDASPGFRDFMLGEKAAPTPQETTAKPYAWAYTWAWGDVLTRHDPTGRIDVGCLRDVKPLYEHPPAPTAPVTTPEIEAARRKALKVILTRVACEKDTSDLYSVRLALGVLRDLVGQPRRFPDTRIGNYDEPAPAEAVSTAPRVEPVVGEAWTFRGPTPPPARLSVEQIAAVIANNGATRVDPTGDRVVKIARTVHEAVYGKDV